MKLYKPNGHQIFPKALACLWMLLYNNHSWKRIIANSQQRDTCEWEFRINSIIFTRNFSWGKMPPSLISFKFSLTVVCFVWNTGLSLRSHLIPFLTTCPLLSRPDPVCMQHMWEGLQVPRITHPSQEETRGSNYLLRVWQSLLHRGRTSPSSWTGTRAHPGRSPTHRADETEGAGGAATVSDAWTYAATDGQSCGCITSVDDKTSAVFAGYES